MPFPKTLEELHAAGYRLGNNGKCKGCGAEIVWVHTPSGSTLPIDRFSTPPTVKAHFASCPMATRFRKKGWKAVPKPS